MKLAYFYMFFSYDLPANYHVKKNCPLRIICPCVQMVSNTQAKQGFNSVIGSKVLIHPRISEFIIFV